MSMKVCCDLCKVTTEDDMTTYEIKKGKAGSGVTEAFAAHVCDECAKALDAGSFIHKFKSMGAIDLVQRAQQSQLEEQRAAGGGQIAPPNAPIPMDPATLAKLQGR